MTESGRIIQVLVGHESVKLKEPTSTGHTHRWVLFVRPANPEYKDFDDCRFISKVKFKIHDSFPNPVQVIKEPPFSVSETGYASFSTIIDIYMNLPNQKSHTIQYELNLSLEKTGYHDEIQKLNIKSEMPPFFIDLANKYCLKKKGKRKSSIAEDDKSPPEKKPKKEKKHRDESSSSKSSQKEKKSEKKLSPKKENLLKEKENSSKLNSIKPSFISSKPQSSNFAASFNSKKKNESNNISPLPSTSKGSPINEKSASIKDGADVLTEKITKIRDDHTLYKVSEFLLGISSTKLSAESLVLSFDLSTLSSSELFDLSKILKSSS